MELILTSTLISAFFVGFTYLGFIFGVKYERKQQEKSTNKIEVNNTNIKFLEELTELLNYDYDTKNRGSK